MKLKVTQGLFSSLACLSSLLFISSCSSIQMIQPLDEDEKSRDSLSFEREVLEAEQLELTSSVDFEIDPLREFSEEELESFNVDEDLEDFVELAVKQRERLDEQVREDQEKNLEEQEAKALAESNVSKKEYESEKTAKTDLPLEYHDNLYKFWNNYFINRDKERFVRHLENGEKYRTLIKRVFREYGLPEDLFYVGLIESGFNIHIQSHAAAVGPWQFIAGTATRYGMRVENQIDERRNIIKSTEAAAKYFQDLYNIFGSWELALCAYNAGEYRIINAIRRGKTRSYKELVDKKLIPRETIYYVPKVAAARDISKARQDYGISVKKRKDEFYTNAQLVDVKRNFTLKEVSKVAGIDMSILEALNPDFRWKEMSASGNRPIRLAIPNKYTQKVTKNFDQGTRTRYTASSSSVNSSNVTNYRVKRGDHLIGISRRFGVSVNEIKRLNGLRSNRIYAGQNLKVSSSNQGEATRYRVQRGDSLISIGRRFNVSVQDIRSANNLRGSRILVGQNLTIPGAGTRVYVVRRGDNLTRIARRFNTSISTIVKTNQLNSETIFPGQKLRVPTDG